MNAFNNREDFKKWILATSNSGDEIQEDLNVVVGYDEKFNNAIVRHPLDLKNETIIRNPNPLNVTFQDVKKFDLVNQVIGKLATQVKASKLTGYGLTKRILGEGETDKLQNRFDLFKEGLNDIINKDNNDNRGGSGGLPEGEKGRWWWRYSTKNSPPPNLFVGNTPAENSRRIAQNNGEKFQNRRLRDREREISNITRGIVKSRGSTLDINFPDTPPPTPFRDNYFPQHPSTPRETSYLFSEGSWSPLRNRLPNIAPLPSIPSIDNFARPLTQIVDDKSNTIEITPKKPAPDINETNLSQQLQEFFPNVNEVIKEDNDKPKERIDDLNEILTKICKGGDENDQNYLNLNFLQVEKPNVW